MDNAGVVESSNRLGLSKEAVSEIIFSKMMFKQDLNGLLTMKLEVLSLIRCTESAFTEQVTQLIFSPIVWPENGPRSAIDASFSSNEYQFFSAILP